MVMKSKINSTTDAAFQIQQFMELKVASDESTVPRVNRFHAGCNQKVRRRRKEKKKKKKIIIIDQLLINDKYY